MTPEERKAFADAADEAIGHPLVQRVVDEFDDNMRHAGPDATPSLFRYGLTKCLGAVAQVARAQALGIDPQELRMSREETAEHIARMAQLAADAGKPVIVVQPPPQDEPSP